MAQQKPPAKPPVKPPTKSALPSAPAKAPAAKAAAPKPPQKKASGRPARLAEIAEQYETPVDEVNALYDELLANEKETHPNLDEAGLQGRAVRRVYLQMKRNSGFGTTDVKGVILGSSDVIDMNAKKIREARELFAKSPQLAVQKRITDAKGTPLDTRQAFDDGTPNPNYRKPLSEKKLRYITFGVYTWPDQTTPVPMTMFLDGKLEVPPLMQQVTFKASFIKPSEKEGENGIINVPESVKFEAIGPANVQAIVAKFLDRYKSDIANLGEYVAVNGQKNTVIVEGDITQMFLEPEEGKSRSLRIDDDSSLSSRDIQGAAVWLPDHIVIDGAEDSRVIVVGSGRASEKGVSIQAQGVYFLPEYKIPLPTEGLDRFTEEEVEGEESTEGQPGEHDGETEAESETGESNTDADENAFG